MAYVRNTIIEAENRRHTEIWLASTEGATPPMRLTSPAFSASAPRWSPDGALLAFTSRRPLPGRAPAGGGSASGAGDGDPAIWFLRMDRPGGEAFQIEGVTGAPVFSPDNRWIAFTKATPPAAAKPAPASESDRTIGERFKGRIFDWMQYRMDGRGYVPDPRDPAATPPQELFVVPRSGGAPVQITRLGVNVTDVAWRPDSRAIAFIANTHQRDEHTYPRADLWTVAIDGERGAETGASTTAAGTATAATTATAGTSTAAAMPMPSTSVASVTPAASAAPKRLTDDGYHHSAPTWSPDGRTIVVQRQLGLSAVIAAKQAHGADIDLYRIPAEGGAMENLTKEWDRLPASPQIGPDGRSVYFSAGVGGATQLFRVPLAGGRVEQVTGEPVVADGARDTTRDRDGFSFAAAFDRVAFIAADATRPGELYVARLGARATDERKLTAVSDTILQARDIGRTERLLYKSKDGTPIEGWVVLPPGYDAAKGPYPLILNIHGGPHGAYGPAFSFPFQFLAAHGFVVLFTNPRGSTGYGESFLWATWGGGWGRLDYDDVMAGVDAALARYPIDARRLGVTGYSYGGFLTNWAITKTRRFAAAASGAGVSNWISDYGTADIPRTKESEFFGTPWQPSAAALLLAQSPIMHAAGVTTPTLFIHGEADVRVPIEQAEQMYLALQKQRVPARFVRYPDMFHGGWTPWNTVHRLDQELKWWTQYLRPDARGTK